MTDIKRVNEVKKSDAFDDWFTKLRDRTARARIQKRLDQIELNGHYGDHKFFGDIGELRFHFGPGYRVYFVQDGKTIVVLLNGGDKDSQQSDIQQARRIAKEYFDGDAI